MKRKESAFKSMLKQATPPIELDAVWEDVSTVPCRGGCGTLLRCSVPRSGAVLELKAVPSRVPGRGLFHW